MKRKYSIPITAVIVAVVALLFWRGDKSNSVDHTTELAPSVQKIRVAATKPMLMTFEDTVTFVGNLEAEERASVASKVSDVTVLSVNVDVGDEIKRGDILVEMDDSLNRRQIEEARAAVARAEAAIAQAKSRLSTVEKDYKRYKQLYEEQVISRQQFDQTEGQYEVEKAGLDLAQRELKQAQARLEQLLIVKNYHKVAAPVGGVIAERRVDPGDTIKSGDVLLVISRQDNVKIKGPITENDYPKVKLGQPVHVRVDAFPGREFNGKVNRISPVLDPATRTGEVEALMASQGLLKPGMFAPAFIVVGSHEALALPREAVRQLAGTGEWYCFVASDDVAQQRPIKRGAEQGNWIEITEGIGESDLVITTVVRQLSDGAPVEVATQ
ncbi:MAG TPA: efflux RND transporter periplasmic adaptor subunit [Thermosynergistes sp.]|nr:efflux RND transporter periplasmic adaptor subunit [Thermosynergistes sp.]HXK89391.1 efflux RND transporter periplasmic adaptor subunit [Thermosynergistes sp.]